MTKTMLDQEWDMSLPAAIEAEAQAQAICMQTQGLRAGLPRVPGQGTPRVRRELDVLEWPFFEDRHREFAAWAAEHVPEVAETELDDRCRGVRQGAALTGGSTTRVAEPLDVRTLCLARETLAYHDALADFAFAMQGLGSGPITLFGDDELKAEYLPAVAAGEKIAAFALSEPEAGSDVARDDHDGERRPDHRHQDLDLQRRDRRLLHGLRARARRDHGVRRRRRATSRSPSAST